MLYVHTVTAATVDISVNSSSGEICFNSAQSCSLTDFTQYNVSITDFDGNLISSKEDLPESSCVTVRELLSPDHAPLVLFVQSFNEYIEYSPVSQVITSG